ncbi:MAG TPA: hypothetical protein ENH82_20510 [bacterium]|nr:hypothetical protein [bacterium]
MTSTAAKALSNCTRNVNPKIESIFSRLQTAMSEGIMEPSSEIMEEIFEFITTGFAEEERLLRSALYDDMALYKHLKQHDVFKNTFLTIYQAYKAGEIVDSFNLNLQIAKFMGAHVITLDVDATEFIDTAS